MLDKKINETIDVLIKKIKVNNVKSIQKDWKRIVPYGLYEWLHQL